VWEAENIFSSSSVTLVTNLGGPVFWSQQLLLRLSSLKEVLFPCSISAQFSTLGGLSAAAAPARSGYSAFGAVALRVPLVAPQYASRYDIAIDRELFRLFVADKLIIVCLVCSIEGFALRQRVE
jgi:hypothetical protein